MLSTKPITRSTFIPCVWKMNFIRLLSISTINLKNVSPEVLKSKPKKASSQQWLSRHLSDPYVEKAKRMNYRCRSAFKLLEINEKFNILRPGNVVLDIGASPGSWTQVIVERVNSNGVNKDLPKGTVIAIDKQQIFPIEVVDDDVSNLSTIISDFHRLIISINHNVSIASIRSRLLVNTDQFQRLTRFIYQGATILGNMDFTDSNAQKILLDHLDTQKVDAVLSDMAPNATGVRVMDNENIIKLCYSVMRFALPISKPDATLLVKLWQCQEMKKLESNMAKFYKTVRIVKPNSSRSDSSEIFLLGRNFKGIDQL